MKKTGVTRRIDELGRIVIPKEIRKNLKIRDSDELEIYVKEDNIILNKYAPLSKDNVIKSLLYAINKCSKKNILFTSKDKIIDHYCNNKSILSSLALSNNVIKIIENRVINKSFCKTNIILTNENLSISYVINPIVINGDLIGSLILYDDEYEISEKDINILGVSIYFLEKYLE